MHCILHNLHLDSLPANTSRYDSKRLPKYLIGLVHHEKARRPLLWCQRLLAMINRPLEFLSSNQNLSEESINPRLSRVETCHSRYSILIV